MEIFMRIINLLLYHRQTPQLNRVIMLLPIPIAIGMIPEVIGIGRTGLFKGIE